MLDVLAEEMGYREGGSRLTIEVEDRSGVLYEVAGVIANMKMSIVSTGTFFFNGRRIVVVRIDTEDPSPVDGSSQGPGYKLVAPEGFQGRVDLRLTRQLDRIETGRCYWIHRSAMRTSFAPGVFSTIIAGLWLTSTSVT